MKLISKKSKTDVRVGQKGKHSKEKEQHVKRARGKKKKKEREHNLASVILWMEDPLSMGLQKSQTQLCD